MMVEGIPVEVELVTRPDQIREGVTVYVKPCGICGRVHRAMVLRLAPPPHWLPDVLVWEIVPRPRCTAGHICADPGVLAEGKTWRVVDDLGTPDEVTQKIEVPEQGGVR